MNQKINTWLVRLFSIVWALFLFLDYASHSNYLTKAFTYFEYTGLVITALVISVALAFVFLRRKKKGFLVEVHRFRNLYHYLFVLLFMALIMAFYISKTNITQAAGSAVVVFLARSIGLHLSVFLILAAALGMGNFLLSKTAVTLPESSRNFIGIALGFLVMFIGLFLLGAAGLLNAFVVIIFLVGMLIPGWKHLLNLIKNHLLAKVKTTEIHMAAIVPYGVILFFMAVNFCYTMRPFPVGFDDLNLYMNTPKLIAGYGALTQGGDAYNWSIIMSLGFIVYKSAAVAIFLATLPGILGMLVLYRIARILAVPREWSLFSCAIFYTLPNIIWQSRNDAKVDLALMFITLCGILLLVEFYFQKNKTASAAPSHNPRIPTEFLIWSICGLLIGFAFGIKYTSMLCIFGFLVFIFYVQSGKAAAAGMFFLNFGIIFGLQLTRFAAFEANSVWLTISPLGFAVIYFGLALRGNVKNIIHSFKTALIFGICIGIPFLPWAIKNGLENKSLSLDALLSGKPPLPVLYPEMKGETNQSLFVPAKNFRLIPTPDMDNGPLVKTAGMYGSEMVHAFKRMFKGPEQTGAGSDTTNVKPGKYTDKYEEIRRYLGYEKGFVRFISLPYDLAMKTNVRLWSADTGVLLLIFVPLFMLSFRRRQLVFNILKMILLAFLLMASVLSVEMIAGPFELDKALKNLTETSFEGVGFLQPLLYGLYVPIKKIILISGNLLFPLYRLLTVQSLGFSFMLVMVSSYAIYYFYRPVLKQLDLKSKAFVLITFCILITWMVLSSGIFWYGMAGFAMLTVLISLLIRNIEPEELSGTSFTGYLASSCMGLWFVLILPFQFMPVRYTITTDMSQIDFTSFMDRPFANYAIGAATEKEVYKQFFTPAEQQILNVLNNDKKSTILNVSTFLTYHIVNNDRRVYSDNQLGIFDRIYELSGGDKQKIVEELRRKNVKYILVSLYTPTMDMTPEKSLTRKFNTMISSLLNNPGAQLLVTNRVVERPDGNLERMVDGVRVQAMYHLAGVRMLEPGSVALFEIL